MGEVQSRAGRSGAQPLPLTRRQQKRARRRNAQPVHQQSQQRQPQPQRPAQPAQPAQPPKPVQASAAARPARAQTQTLVQTLAQTQAQLPAQSAQHPAAPADQAPEPVTDKPAKAPRTARAARAKRTTQPPAPATASAPESATPAPVETSPIKTSPRRAKTGAPVQGQKTIGAKRTLRAAVTLAKSAASTAPGASGRKFPTLARMAAVASHTEPEPLVAAGEAKAGAPSPYVPAQAALDAEPRPELLETQPVPALAPSPGAVAAPAPRTTVRHPVPTRRLSAVDDHGRTQMEADTPGAGDSLPHTSSGARPLPVSPAKTLPEPDFVMPVAAVHAGLAAVAALAGAGLLITGAGNAVWPLTLAAVVGAGGWVASLLQERSHRLAAWLLLLAQVGGLAWLLALLGARAALLMLVPALALLALRWLGRVAAYVTTLLALALYVVATLLQLNGVTFSPFALSSTGTALLDSGLVAAGLLATLLLASHLHYEQVRAERAARARQYELRTLRARLAHSRTQVEDDAARLEDALARALAGRSPAAPLETDGLLSPLAETANAAADRLTLLQRDREERLRLEGAVRTVTQAVERAWLGLPWSWPAWSGTALDELVALLRTPRPQETRADWSDGTPTLAEIPAALPAIERASGHELTPHPREQPTPISLPVAAVRATRTRTAEGQGSEYGSEHASDPTSPSLTAEHATPSALLPWKDWDTWGEWTRAGGE